MSARHLNETELIDLLDGVLPAVRREHAAACPECRHKGEMLSHATERIAGREVPEPSPLFWEQFSARVRQSIAEQPPQSRLRALLTFPRAGIAAAIAAAAVVIIAVGIWRSGLPVRGISVPVHDAATASNGSAPEPALDDFNVEPDEGWALVQSIADDLEVEDMDDAGVTARPGSADHVTTGLSESERIELARLLQSEIKARGTESSS